MMLLLSDAKKTVENLIGLMWISWLMHVVSITRCVLHSNAIDIALYAFLPAIMKSNLWGFPPMFCLFTTVQCSWVHDTSTFSFWFLLVWIVLSYNVIGRISHFSKTVITELQQCVTFFSLVKLNIVAHSWTSWWKYRKNLLKTIKKKAYRYIKS